MEFIKDNIILILIVSGIAVVLLAILVLSILTYKRVKLRKPDKKDSRRRKEYRDEDLFD